MKKHMFDLRKEEGRLRQQRQKLRIPGLSWPERSYQSYGGALLLHFLQNPADQGKGRVRPAVLVHPGVLHGIYPYCIRLGKPAPEARKLGILVRREEVYRVRAEGLVHPGEEIRV